MVVEAQRADLGANLRRKDSVAERRTAAFEIEVYPADVSRRGHDVEIVAVEHVERDPTAADERLDQMRMWILLPPVAGVFDRQCDPPPACQHQKPRHDLARMRTARHEPQPDIGVSGERDSTEPASIPHRGSSGSPPPPQTSRRSSPIWRNSYSTEPNRRSGRMKRSSSTRSRRP